MQKYLLLVCLAACSGGDSKPAGPMDAPPMVDAPIDGPPLLNGCTLAMATDLSAPGATREIMVLDDVFSPRCVRIAPGQSVTWNGNFSNHPLSPGKIVNNQIMAQPGNPIPMTGTGTTVTVAFPTAAEWAFYCPNHAPGMIGAIFVVP
jgi:plastocyanin